MATGYSVMDALNKNTKAGIDETPRARFRTRDISIFKMYRNTMNFYDLSGIEELAGEILMYGLKQNLELVYEPNEQGEYKSSQENADGSLSRCSSKRDTKSLRWRPAN